jgi:hypothetical protein
VRFGRSILLPVFASLAMTIPARFSGGALLELGDAALLGRSQALVEHMDSSQGDEAL